MTYSAFLGNKMVFNALSIEESVARCHDALKSGASERLVVIDDENGRAIDIDFRGDMGEVLERLKTHPVLGEKPAEESGDRTGQVGRPRLGVVPREISLLPRHWDWLATQKGGASAAIRRLIDEARKKYEHRDKARMAGEAFYRFIWDMAGNFENFEEASRAFYKKDYDCFIKLIAVWPQDIRRYAESLLDRLIPLENAAAEEEQETQSP